MKLFERYIYSLNSYYSALNSNSITFIDPHHASVMGIEKYRAETNKLMFDLYKFVIKIWTSCCRCFVFRLILRLSSYYLVKSLSIEQFVNKANLSKWCKPVHPVSGMYFL